MRLAWLGRLATSQSSSSSSRHSGGQAKRVFPEPGRTNSNHSETRRPPETDAADCGVEELNLFPETPPSSHDPLTKLPTSQVPTQGQSGLSFPWNKDDRDSLLQPVLGRRSPTNLVQHNHGNGKREALLTLTLRVGEVTTPMAVSEVEAILCILGRVCTFAITIQDRYYKGSAEVASFRSKCLVLGKKHDEWQEQLRKIGAEVTSNGLLELALAADKIREEQDREVQKLKGSRFWRWRKKAFPTGLTHLLARMEEIVDAGPKLLQSKVTNHALLEQILSLTPAPLTFGFDDKYVPILETVDEVQTALGNEHVVTVYGIPGLGKTSLAKYLALKYTTEKDHGMNETPPRTPRFPDGVEYMFCGKGSQDKVKELLQGLLERLGFATDSASSSNDSTQAKSSEAVISSFQRKLTSCLANQTMLIIFDDLWEPTALEQLLVPASGVRYLITSQKREICLDAKKIELKKPTDEQASRILANHTSGLPTKGEFPDSIRDVTNGIMGQLENHPLSLSNIGMSIDGSKATDVHHWEAKKDDLLGVLGAPTEVIGQPSVFNSTYNLPVKASMMVMVDSLVEEARSLLFLMALFGERLVNEELLKFFYSLIVKEVHVSSTYDRYVKYLKDMLVVESQSRGTENMLLTHGLRMRYIQEDKDEELKNIACQIRPGIIDERKAELIRTGDSEETLAAILGATCFRGAFREIFAGALEEHSRIMLYGKLSVGDGHHQYLRRFLRYRIIPKLFPFLNSDGGRGDSEQQAHRYAKKIFIRLVCQRTLDDHGMAGLLQLSEGSAKACSFLRRILKWAPLWRRLFDVNPLVGETLKVLLVHLDKNPTWDVIKTIGKVLEYQSNDDTFLSILAKWGDILRADPNPPIQLAIMETIPRVASRFEYEMGWRPRPGMRALLINGIAELVGIVIVSGKDDELRLAAVRTIDKMINKGIAPRLAVSPAALTKVLDLFISGKTLENVQLAGATLGKLAVFPEYRRIYRAVDGSLESLCDILAKMEGTWRAALREEDRRIVEKQGSLSAGILAELATEKELRETIASLPGFKDGLLFLQLVEMGTLAIEIENEDFLYKNEDGVYVKFPEHLSTLNSTRALTTLCSTSASRYTDLPPFERVLEVFSSDEMPSNSPIVYLSIYWSRVEAHLRMGTYGMVLANLDLADTLLNSTPAVYLPVYCPWSNSDSDGSPAAEVLRDVRIFVKAMLEDTDALLRAYEGVTVEKYWRLVDRGVLKRLIGDLQGALEDLNLAFESCTYFDEQSQYKCLKHRGYVKHLMGNDEDGATKDAESANQLKLQGRAVDVDYDDIERFWSLQALPVEYLGFAL